MKPVFLSKEKRLQLSQERERENQKALKAKEQQEYLYLESQKRPKGELQAKDTLVPSKPHRKFKFEWDLDEDTAQNHVFSLPHLVRNRDLLQFETTEKREMTERDWRIFREDHGIVVKGTEVNHPLLSWKDGDLSKQLLFTLRSAGYEEPTPIQRQAVPILLAKRDMIGVAETGSGKTAAFVVPILSLVSRYPKADGTDGPYCLILVPTRELAQQIENEITKLSAGLGIKCVSIVGGHSIEDQAFYLNSGAEIVIATPGRLRDCLESHIIVLNQCNSIVMDEADRMVDLGFEADVNFILESLPTLKHKRQFCMFSATMPSAIEQIAKNFLKNPVLVTVGNVGEAVPTVEQQVMIIKEEQKLKCLIDLLSKEHRPPILVFVNQKCTADEIYKELDRLRYKVALIHGGKHQEQREMALDLVKSGEKDILIATDVAGRGLDVKNVSLVINYDMAKNIQEYTHRIGRTGRAGKQGTSMTFLTIADSELFYDLKQMVLKSPISRCPPELMRHELAMNKPGTFQQKRKHEETLFK